MNKISFMRLWDLYNKLLTPTQQEITNLYFNLDLTVSEIAEAKGMTRQGASDCLASCKKQLEEYENKLHFSELLQKGDRETSFRLTDITRWALRFEEKHPDLSSEIAELKELIDKDYEKEVLETLK